MFLYPISKDSQWETAKAGYRNDDVSLYGASHKTCFGVVLNCIFEFMTMFLSVALVIKTKCD